MPKTATTYRLDDEIIELLKAVKERDGIPVSEQVRRALAMWLESKGYKTERKRPASRKRS